MKKVILLLIMAAFLAGCGEEEDSNASNNETVSAINAELKVPDKAELNAPQTFTVTVTQDGEPVEDADEVEFEIWKDGMKDDSEMIAAEHTGDGKYTVEKKFEEAGVYHVQSHVSARAMHTMPKQEITVGNPQT
ncbi:FixH family protein [Virgibacillus kekensis]|uniref:FixH family protein n=1 Tax=Virgibacillus kekensis TaxID=202261 RepID=A0ABV9DFM9_9BACI